MRNNIKSLHDTFHFEDNIGWLKFNFNTKTWWFYTHDGIPYNTKKFDINKAIYLIQLTKRVVAEVDGYGPKNEDTLQEKFEKVYLSEVSQDAENTDSN